MGKPPAVLTVNAGSSSVKFCVYAAGSPPAPCLRGTLERLGRPDARLSLSIPGRPPRSLAAADQPPAEVLLEALRAEALLADLTAIGHRIVHGGPRLTRACPIDDSVLDELGRLLPWDPEHLPLEIELVKTCRRLLPHVQQVACFDTEFHRTLPRVAQLLPLPRRYFEAGVRRYGFHGLSCSYLMSELARVAGAAAARGRVILAHLGGGCSLTAVADGQSLDTTMAFTPAAGVPMGTRPGDLDPGLFTYLTLGEGRPVAEVDAMLHHQSGLLGLSETSADVRDLVTREAAGDLRAADALALFCQEVKKRIGALAAVLGGLDTLVFSGGIGEHAPALRARIVAGLESFGIRLDEAANEGNAPLVSRPPHAVAVRVIPTDEEVVIARATLDLIASHKEKRS
jgi:acetate kinase